MRKPRFRGYSGSHSQQVTEQEFELKHVLGTEEVQERERITNNISRRGLRMTRKTFWWR